MILNAVAKEEIGVKSRNSKKGKELKSLINDFRSMCCDYAEVINTGTYNNDNDMRNSIKNYLKNHDIEDIECFMLNGNVYLTKEQLVKEKSGWKCC